MFPMRISSAILCRHSCKRACATIVVPLLLMAANPSAQAAPSLPEIRMHRQNGVPACVTPDRLMAFLQMRNPSLPTRYRDIAKWYRHHGEAWRVRWDFAFYQMALETNFLTYRRGNGDPGDVRARQNNFAGIGATGGGVPGDRFPDVGTGVLAQIQHLVAYSGERVEQPVAPRTALKQTDIVETMRRLKRPVRFSDLARRWAADPRYASSIASIAESFNRSFCVTPTQQSDAASGGAASKKRGQLVARTIWRRRDLPSNAVAVIPPLPQPAHRMALDARQHSGQDGPANGILSGLQNMARSMHQSIGAWPAKHDAPRAIVAPVPRPAERVPRIASRE